jgi:hypothetical protein
VLAQLGNRVQHSLRAFTAEDAEALRAATRTYPKSDLYDLESLLTSLGIGEAAVTVLTAKGTPTPVVHTRLVAPRSSMAPAADVPGAAARSPLNGSYGARIDRESARELLAKRLESAQGEEKPAPPAPKTKAKAKAKQDGDNPVVDFLSSRQGQTITREVVRGVFGLLKKRR